MKDWVANVGLHYFIIQAARLQSDSYTVAILRILVSEGLVIDVRGINATQSIFSNPFQDS